ncbi:MAG TPA: putative sulfate/molybdate transporter [Candidatus Nitrosotenuis sp.]|nr:putative sulfate/molybdate transporter [Candidatus Nitrosotenuis sp.]
MELQHRTGDGPGARRIRFDRNELAGSFGDIGTDLPLIAGIILATGLDSASIFIVFGLLQMVTGLFYGLPMPMQPLKAMAVIVITQKVSGDVLLGGGLAIGAMMAVLTLSGGLNLLARWIPLCVVRGIQFGLGLSLASLALKTYIPAEGVSGYALAGAGLLIMLSLWGNRRLPPGLLVIALGLLYALVGGLQAGAIVDGFGLALPTFHRPQWQDIWSGFLLLALPQLPLSLSNSVIATEQTIRDLFPGRAVSVRKIGLTYSVINLVAPLLGGIPVCHGCGGLAGHYAFGARTGGSVVLYGAFYLLVGLFLSGPLAEVLKVFPQPILGTVLLFEALTLLALIRDQAREPRHLRIALLVAVVALAVPGGFVVGLLLGSLVFYGFARFGQSPEEPGPGQ